MGILPEGTLAYVGVKTDPHFAGEPIERGGVRRFVHAIMDDNPIFHDPVASSRYGGPVAPPLYPANAFRRGFLDEDAIQKNAQNSNYDGTGGASLQGLPEIEPLKTFAVLNGGSEIELYRYAKHGERISTASRYESISEKATSKGPIILVVITSEYRTEDGELLLRVKRTQIRKPT